MNFPNCKKPMKKVKWELTDNYRVGKDYKEYDKYTYECREDDFWVTGETPVIKQSKK